jgi:hypothetical protein
VYCGGGKNTMFCLQLPAHKEIVLEELCGWDRKLDKVKREK